MNEATTIEVLKIYASVISTAGVLFAVTLAIEIDYMREGRAMSWIRAKIRRFCKIILEGF